MLKKKTIKTVLIIFLLVTAIGVMSSLFGGLRLGKTSSGGSSSGSGSSNSGNSGSSEVDEHNYSAYNVCKDCGYSPVHTKIADKYSIPQDESDFHLTESFDHHENCAFLVLFNQGTEREKGYYVIYDGNFEFESEFMNEDTWLRISDGSLSIVSGTSDYFSGDTDVTVYIADPSAKYVSFNCDIFNDITILVDGDAISSIDGAFAVYESIEVIDSSCGMWGNIHTVEKNYFDPMQEFAHPVLRYEDGMESVTIVPKYDFSEINIGC